MHQYIYLNVSVFMEVNDYTKCKFEYLYTATCVSSRKTSSTHSGIEYFKITWRRVQQFRRQFLLAWTSWVSYRPAILPKRRPWNLLNCRQEHLSNCSQDKPLLLIHELSESRLGNLSKCRTGNLIKCRLINLSKRSPKNIWKCRQQNRELQTRKTVEM